jgi:hypothetical protein
LLLLLVMLVAGASVDVALPWRTNQSPQSADPTPRPSVILEVTHTTFSIFENSENKYLYLRVLSDGSIECQSPFPIEKSESNERRSYRKILTQEEFKALQSLIDQPQILKIQPKYRAYVSVDTSSEWGIKLQHHGETQRIVVGMFSPGLAREFKQPYPKALTKLGCTVQKLRHEVVGDPAEHIDSDCKKVLQLE